MLDKKLLKKIESNKKRLETVNKILSLRHLIKITHSYEDVNKLDLEQTKKIFNFIVNNVSWEFN